MARTVRKVSMYTLMALLLSVIVLMVVPLSYTHLDVYKRQL